MREYRVLCADGKECPEAVNTIMSPSRARAVVEWCDRWHLGRRPHRAEVREVRPWKEIP